MLEADSVGLPGLDREHHLRACQQRCLGEYAHIRAAIQYYVAGMDLAVDFLVLLFDYGAETAITAQCPELTVLGSVPLLDFAALYAFGRGVSGRRFSRLRYWQGAGGEDGSEMTGNALELFDLLLDWDQVLMPEEALLLRH